MENKFKITLEDDLGIYSVELFNKEGHIGDYVNAFRSVLRSASFSEKLINEYIKEYEPDYRQDYLGDM